jgi:hypothetical protein
MDLAVARLYISTSVLWPIISTMVLMSTHFMVQPYQYDPLSNLMPRKLQSFGIVDDYESIRKRLSEDLQRLDPTGT